MLNIFKKDNSNKIRNASAMYHLLVEDKGRRNPYKTAKLMNKISSKFERQKVFVYKENDKKYSIPNFFKQKKQPISTKNK